jgi:hypothetical protein
MLENNVDLIVSRFSLRHMIDPIGTMLQAYDLLKPNTGLILTDDFSFLLHPILVNPKFIQ